MLKYAPQADKSRIRECFESMPRQLSKENKKFAYATVRPNGRGQDYQGSLQWIEVKASNGNIKSTKTLLAHPEKYHVAHAIKLGDVNVGTAPQTLILPLYMAFLLGN